MILPVRLWPDPVLLEVAKPLTASDFEPAAVGPLGMLLSGMVETMKSMNGLGLAMPQVGVSKRGIVVLLGYQTTDERVVEMLNPDIVLFEGDVVDFKGEGCLSFPGVRVDTQRFDAIGVRFLDRNGHEQFLNLKGLDAVVVQHEVEHLNGKLLIDRVGSVRRAQISSHMSKVRKQLMKAAKAQGLTEDDAGSKF